MTGATVWKGRGDTTLLVSLSSTPTIFAVVVKALLELGPILQFPPSHLTHTVTYTHSNDHLPLPSCPWLHPAGTW